MDEQHVRDWNNRRDEDAEAFQNLMGHIVSPLRLVALKGLKVDERCHLEECLSYEAYSEHYILLHGLRSLRA